MADKNIIFDKIADSIISYLEFVKKFKKVKPDEIINLDKFIYIFRHFNVECYLIDKEIFNEFRSAINFDDFIAIFLNFFELLCNSYGSERSKKRAYMLTDLGSKLIDNIDAIKKYEESWKNVGREARV